MNPTRVLRAAQGYVPLIKFKGHHVPPATIDHSPQTHPASPNPLPDSFARYRQSSQQHGPLGGHASNTGLSASGNSQGKGHSISYGAIGSTAGSQLGSVKADEGVAFDRSELPARFGRLRWNEGEIEAVESAGASLW